MEWVQDLTDEYWEIIEDGADLTVEDYLIAVNVLTCCDPEDLRLLKDNLTLEYKIQHTQQKRLHNNLGGELKANTIKKI